MDEEAPQSFLFCSFCTKNSNDVELMVAQPDGRAFICSECIAICVDILRASLSRVMLPADLGVE